MRIRIVLCTVLATSCSSSFAAEDTVPTFHAPVQLMAGDSAMGEGILYPSPKMQDLNGDGVPEMLIGDLRGQLLVAERQGSGDSVQWSELKPLETADGKPIKFDNW